MNTPDKPPREKGWVMVKAGQILDASMQFWDAFDRKWVPISKQSVGWALDDDSYGHFRRRTK